MPSSRPHDLEQCLQLLSIYLRPWTLSREDVLEPHVPHLLDLDVVQRDTEGLVTRSWRGAWKQYIRGSIVSEHARRRWLALIWCSR